MAPLVLELDGVDDYLEPAMAAGGRLPPGTLLRRPGVAAALDGIAAHGRAAFYLGAFGDGLLGLGKGLFSRDDLARTQAEWVDPVAVDAWGHTVHTAPPPSQGYLTLAGAAVAGGLALPDDPDDPAWAHLLVEAARVTGSDRAAVLHDAAEPAGLLDVDRLDEQRSRHRPRPAAPTWPRAGAVRRHDRTCCAVDARPHGRDAHPVERLGVRRPHRGAGHRRVPPRPRHRLHPRRRPPGRPGPPAAVRPHTLSPALVTRPDGSLRAVLGTMGGDSQPQILLQLLARLLRHDESPGRAVRAGRWVLGHRSPAGDHGGFDTWAGDGPERVEVEAHAPAAWDAGLAARGHEVWRSPAAIDHGFGHAQVIALSDGVLAGIADPRSLDGAAAGY